MVYAVEKEGKIQVFGVLPKSYHSSVANVIGGFDKLPDSELEKHGFYPVEYPAINQRTQQRGTIYFDSAAKKFKYNVLDKALPPIEGLKSQKVTNITEQKERYLKVTDADVLEAFEAGAAVSTEISASRAEIRTQALEIKTEIGNLTTHDGVYAYTRGFHLVQTGSIKY